MATIGDDCYFFCTSSCAKGAACPFRHVDSAKTAKVICQHWEMGGCMRPMCKFRHSNFKLQVDSSDVACYWESQPVGCTKPNCLYKHSKPRSQNTAAAPVTISVPSSTATEPSVAAPITSSTTQNIVPPLVKPVVIQPAKSDESNTSPVKLAMVQGSGQLTTKESVPNPEDNQKTTNLENTKQETKAEKVNVKEKSAKSKIKAKKVKVNSGKKLVKAKEDMSSIKPKQLGKKMKNPNVQKKSVRERLGAAPVQTSEPPAVESSESESDSDSDDSIENIKVMSMEEIFRQKALESMLKKRAENNTQTSQMATTPSTVFLEKKTQAVAAEAESSSSTSSSSAEEEETSDEKETTMKASSDSDSSNSSSDSEEEEDDDDDEPEFEPDVRRVIVQEENEKVARKKAHASLQKKQISIHPPEIKGKKMSGARVPVRQSAAVSSKQTMLKKRKVNVDYDSDDIVSCRVKEPLVLNVRDRLGNSLNNKKIAVSASLQSRSERLELSSGIPRREANSPHKSKIVKVSKSNSDEEQNPLADIKIKTLEEIRQEKMRKLASQQHIENKPQSTVRQRLGLKQNDPDTKRRQILIISGSKSDDADNAGITEEQKKSKKRPWRTQKRGMDQVNVGDGGDGGRTTLLKQRLVSADRDMPEEEQIIEESPFERLRRKALMKKKKTIEAKRLKLHASMNEEHDLRIQASPKRQVLQHFEDLDVDNDEPVEEAVDNSSNKKHKHRHKHKQHRKSKTERQIYVPPAMKSSAMKEEDVTMKEAVVAPTAKVAPQKRGPHPIAAAWAAGLTLSAKGTLGKRPAAEVMPISGLGTNEKTGIVSRLNIKENSPEKKCTKVQTIEQIEQPSEVTIKSFSEIMAEKRRKRLEMQAQKSGANSSTGLMSSDSSLASSVSLSSMSATSSPSKNIANKPRVPITPIVFNTADTAMSSDRLRPTVDPPLTAPPKPVTQQPDAPVFTSSSKSNPVITHNRESQQRVKLKSLNSAGVKNKKIKLFKKRKSIEHSNDTNISEDSDLSNSSNNTPSSYSVKTETSPLTKPATHQKGTSSNVSSYHSHNPVSTPKNHGNTHSHLPSTSAVSLVSPYGKEPDTAASVYKQPVSTETEPVKKSRPSLEDEFSFFDDVGFDDDNFISGDVEPIDDLLQDIDDLLA